MKNLMILSVVLLGVSFSQASTCKVYSDQQHGNKTLGEVVMQNGENGYSEGYLLVDSYDAAYIEYSKVTASYQIRITQDNIESPYKISLQLLANNRNVESQVEMVVNELPAEVSFDLTKNEKNYPVVSDSASSVVLKCGEK